VPVLHRRGDDARRRRGQERLDEAVGLVEHGAEIRALGVDGGRIKIAYLVDRLGRMHVADGGPARELLLHHALENRVTGGVAARPPLPGAAKAARPVLHVEEEALALLLAVVADVDPGGDLLGHHPSQRLLAGRGEFRRVDRLALRAAHVQPDQLGRTRQAAGVRDQDPFVAPLHGCPPVGSTAAYRRSPSPSRGTRAVRAARTSCWSKVASGASARSASSR
jgi:hypothetical protein